MACDIDCGTLQVTDLLLDWEALKWPQANCALPLALVLSQGLGEVSLQGFVPSNLGVSLAT